MLGIVKGTLCGKENKVGKRRECGNDIGEVDSGECGWVWLIVLREVWCHGDVGNINYN